jgi:DNA invertase Pin-like site-specific DNA recombinase
MKTDFTKRGWIRAKTKKDENNQRAALAEIGCTQVYVYGIDTPEDLFNDLRKRDTVCMTTLARISPSRKDLEPFMAEVHDRKATILEVSTGRRTDTVPNVAKMMADAVSELTGEARAMAPGEAVRNGRKGGKAKAKAVAKARASIVEAKSVWYNPRLSNAEVLAHYDFRGWSKSSAYRKFGSRGISSGPRKS